MKAFTQLCGLVYISLMDDAITLYPTSDLSEQRIGHFHNELIRRDIRSKPVLDILTLVREKDADHAKYHKDDFDDRSTHFHFRFKKTLNEEEIEEILTVLRTSRLLTKDEKTSFITAYRAANTMSAAPAEVPTTAPSPEVVDTRCCLFSFFGGGAPRAVAPAPASTVSLS
jgi:hypothetical protein